jgi:hypothetical protein
MCTWTDNQASVGPTRVSERNQIPRVTTRISQTGEIETIVMTSVVARKNYLDTAKAKPTGEAATTGWTTTPATESADSQRWNDITRSATMIAIEGVTVTAVKTVMIARASTVPHENGIGTVKIPAEIAT